MKVTIELTDSQVKVLGKWASVSRTLNSAKVACDVALGEGDGLPDHIRTCRDELDIIEPVLDSVHRTIRDQIWVLQALSS